MAKRVLAYECKYCGTLKKSQTIAERHEITCMKGTDPRNCSVCENSFLTQDGLKCRKGIKCSSAVSAKCEYFRKSLYERS